MRDGRFIAVHRGGPLSLQRHRLLAAWAAECAEHVLPLFSEQQPEDQRPARAIAAARAWSRGEISVGEARAASVAAHAAARDVAKDAANGMAKDMAKGAAKYVARAAGHAVATAHMADHAPGAAYYAIKAITAATDGQAREAALEQERSWQKAILPEEIRELILSTFAQKFARLGL
ncbi:MAG: putative immunity protein [Candidatus Sericytochromatia bacterium]